MENENQPVRVRLFFSDKHLLSKDQRAKGLRRSWAVLRRDISTAGRFVEHIKSLFALRCKSAHDLFLSMDGFVVPSFESTCIFRDKDLVRVETSITKKRKKNVITDGSPAKEKEIIEKETILSIENGDLANHEKKRKNWSEKPETSKKKLKLDGASDDPINHFVIASNNNKQIVVCQTGTHADGSNEKNERGPNLGNGVLEQPPSHLMHQTNFMPRGAGPSNWQAGQPKHNGSNFKRNNWNKKDNSQDGWNKSHAQYAANNSQFRNGNNYNMNEDTDKGKSTVENEEESDDDDELDFESLYPLIRLPKEGDIIAYRIVDNFSPNFELSQSRVGEVLIFDPVLMLIVLGSVPRYPIFFPNGEIPKDSPYQQDGTLEIDFGALIDLRLVKESQLDIAPKRNCNKSGKMKNKGEPNNGENANGNADNNWEAGAGNDSENSGNNNTNSAWEAVEASNTREESGWGTWPPSNKRTSSLRLQMGQNSNIGVSSRGGFCRRNTNRGGGNSERNSSVGQDRNFGSRGGFSFRGRNGRGARGKYNNFKLGS